MVFIKGNKGYWLGKKLPETMIEKLSLSHKGIKCINGFKKGCTAWNKGKTFMQKENHPNWKGGITTQDKLERAKFRRTIQKIVLERDNYTCQICKERGGQLQVDHIQSWTEYVEMRFCIDNCRTVCMSCHYYLTYRKPLPENIKSWGHNFKQIYG